MFLRKHLCFALALSALGVSSACRQDMHNQPKYKPYSATDFFGDSRAMRPTIKDTIARGQLRLNEARYTGKQDGKDVTAIPIQITRADIVRGKDRFQIYCTPCHGQLGDGRGMIVLRGLRQPPSYHDERLVNAPIGHFFDVITNGYGSMYSYASRVSADDRWRIASYIRTLQLSQNAPPDLAARAAAETGAKSVGGQQ